MNAFWKLCLFQVAIVPLFGSQHTVVSGSAEISQPVSSHQIITASDKAVLHWDDFSIDQGKTLEFILPESKASVLNRVVGKHESQLLGNLISNGHVYLVNPNGIFIGGEAIIRTASFLASTLDMNTEHFLKSGDEGFTSGISLVGMSQAKITNLGTIEAWDGDIVFASYGITNEGVLKAPKGTVALGAAEHVVFQPSGDQRFFIKKPASEKPLKKTGTGIAHTGSIEAIKAELLADGNVYALAIQCSGVVEASNVKEENGRILLTADQGRIEIAGDLSAENKEGTGGYIGVFADEVLALGKAKIDASGSKGGGEVFLGGSFQGKDRTQPHASWTYVGPEAVVSANATCLGNGGKVVVWADGATQFYGKASVYGDGISGKGGLVEVSGGYLDYNPKIAADLRGAKGLFGTLLLDPYDLSIISTTEGSEQNVTTETPFKPTGGSAKLLMSTLSAALQAGGDIVVQTGADAGVGNGDISVLTDLILSGPEAATLTFNATGDVLFYNTMNLSGSISKVSITGHDVKFLQSSSSSLESGLLLVKEVEITNYGDLIVDASSANHNTGIDAGSIQIDTGGNISIIGGLASSESGGQAYIGVGSYQDGSAGIIRDITCQGTLSIMGNSMGAWIGNLNNALNIVPETRITAKDIIVKGGNGAGGFSFIGEMLVNNSVEERRELFVSCAHGGNLKVIGGSDGAVAGIGQMFIETNESHTLATSVNIDMNGGDIIIKGGSGSGSWAGLGFIVDSARFDMIIEGQITIEGAKDIVVEGGSATHTPACLGYMVTGQKEQGSDYVVQISSFTENFTSGMSVNNITGQLVVAGNAYSESYGGIGIVANERIYVAASSPDLSLVINSPDLKAINLISGSQTADPFSSAGAYLGVLVSDIDYDPGAKIDITVNAPSAAVNLLGPNLPETYDFASLGIVSSINSVELLSNLHLDVGDVKFLCPQISLTPEGGAFISNLGDNSGSMISRSSVSMNHLTIENFGGLRLLNPTQVEIRGDMKFDGGLSTSGAYLLIDQSEDFTGFQKVDVGGGVLFKGSSHLLYNGAQPAICSIGKYLRFFDISDIQHRGTSPKLTVIVDNQFPASPDYDFQSSMEFGVGTKIKMDSASSLAASEVKLYAVAPNITTLPKVDILDDTYTTPGLMQTHIYYPEGNYKMPFSVYYKVPNAVIPTQYTIKDLSSILEEFDHLRFNFDKLNLKQFRIDYKSKGKDSWGQKGAISSFDLFEDMEYIEID